MDFNQLTDEVYKITNRRDLAAETELAVKSATLQLHRQEYFYKDLREDTLVFSINSMLQEIDYRNLYPRYRALNYIRKYDPTAVNSNISSCYNTYDSYGMGDFFKVLTPQEVLDSYSITKLNTCYVAGELIKLRSSTNIKYAVIGVYLNPDVSSAENYNSWIAIESPYAIVWQAAAIIYGGVLGNPSRQNSALQQAQVEFGEVRNSNILAEGY